MNNVAPKYMKLHTKQVRKVIRDEIEHIRCGIICTL